MSQNKEINVQKLRSFCNKAEFRFSSTEELPDFEGMIGQDRAVDALSFAINMNKPGYNMYLMGSNGLGKQTMLKQILSESLTKKNTFNDWCYVYNFDEPNKPKAINLSAGQGDQLEKELQQLLRELDIALASIFENEKISNRQKAVQDSVSLLINEFGKNHQKAPEVLDHLKAIEKDLINSLEAFCNGKHAHLPYEECLDFLAFQNYEVNVIVKQKSSSHAPVIMEDNPTIVNLFGTVEYLSQMGSLVTDYHYIKSGSLHRANGGYLIVDADKLVMQPDVWDIFKRALANNKIKIPPADVNAGNVSLVSIQPEAIALDVKIILVGSRALYNKLVEDDDDFSELFKVEVDFSATIDCNKESLNQYAKVIATLIRKNKLLHFEQDAVECVIEYGMRLIEDTTQLYIHMHSILEILIESEYWAKNKDSASSIVKAKDVKHAIDKQIYRADRSRESIYDEIRKGTIHIDVTGEKIATVNGLFVIETARLEYAQPAKITANVRIGDGDIIDIEREVDLGGPLHSKGVLILSSYLGSRYAKEKPLSFSASLVFEQSYGHVDGDSATVGELCTLLSAISKIPVKQSLAITGSADQHGNIQAIGGINEKIEGFFDICKLKGLTGEQGVILPAVNIPHLILRDDVVDAIEKNEFYLYAVNTVDEAISLLTGLPAGTRDEKGSFAEGTVNYKVEQRLLELAELKHDDKDDHDCSDEEKESKKDNK